MCGNEWSSLYYKPINQLIDHNCNIDQCEINNGIFFDYVVVQKQKGLFLNSYRYLTKRIVKVLDNTTGTSTAIHCKKKIENNVFRRKL